MLIEYTLNGRECSIRVAANEVANTLADLIIVAVIIRVRNL